MSVTATLLSLPPALALALPSIVALGRRLRRTPEATAVTPEDSELPALLILVPAHDEEILIAGCVRSLLATDYHAARRRVVVIADNCADSTALRARAAGADVVERTDPLNPGKPAALAWALSQLPVQDHDAIVIVDADTVVAPGFARAFAPFAPLGGIAVQGYFGTSNEWDNWLTRLAGLLARARYELVYPSRERAGLNVPLTGNGMCIGRDLLAGGRWDAFSLSEDLELYARLTSDGVRIHYARNALIHSQEASSLRAGRSQRERWARGRLQVLGDSMGPLLRSRRIGWLQKLDTLLELALPSPALRLATSVAVGAAALLLPAPARWLLLGGAALFIAPDAWAIGGALVRHPQPLRTLTALAMLPFYALWRLSVAARSLLSASDTTWRKTARNAPPTR